MSDLALPRTDYKNELSPARLAWDLRNNDCAQYGKFWTTKPYEIFPPKFFDRPQPMWLEIGAGTGNFFVELAKLYPDRFLVAVERCKTRGQRLMRKTQRSGLTNVAGFRGNAVPLLIQAIPDAALERIYILYPCPWAKTAQRRNRWHLHPAMPHLLRVLKPGGLIVWASDQKFYIDEAEWVCRNHFKMETLVHGPIAPNAYNDLDGLPQGRTKFEQTFLKNGQPCHELVVRKV